MGITSVVTIDGVAYTASQRASARILPTGLSRSLDGGYDEFTFWEIPTTPEPSFVTGQTASVTIDIGDGNGAVTRFAGVIDDCQSEHGQLGWGHAYTCTGLKRLADKVPVTGVDGTGTQAYNRSPLDEYFTPSDAGLELGEIIERILCIPATAQALNAYGIGGFTGLPSAPVLPAATLADLALLTIVPPRPVIFSGEGVFNAIDQEVSQWMPRFFSEIQPDGIIRFKDTISSTYFPPQTITCPSASGLGDPVTPPRVQRSTQNCATRLILRGGPQVEVAILSLLDGTLAEVFTSTDKTNWDLTYFTAPKGATDYGTVTAVTANSATLTSHDASATWPANFWSNNEAIVTLVDTLAAGINQFETRRVTSNDALAAGGTSTVNWDSTWPITNTSYDKYRITGGSGGLVDCWRTYTPREPSTGLTGLDTWVGSHLVTKSAFPVRVANQVQSFDTYYTTATIVGGSLGQEFPLGVQAVPSEGIFRFTQPTVTVFGQTSTLNAGSPTTAADGLPLDVVIYALYSRGALSVVVPSDIAGVPQYEGTAYTEDGIETTKTLDFPGWIWLNDTTSFGALAQQVLDTISNAEVDLDISWFLTPDGPVPNWDFLSFGYALNVAIAGQASPWDDVNAPVRQIGVKWDWTGQGTQMLNLHASTRRRAFSGFDLYIHPEFAQGSPLGSSFGSATGNYQEANALMGIDTNQAAMQGNYQQWSDQLSQHGAPSITTPNDVRAGAGGVGGLAATPGSLMSQANNRGINSGTVNTGNLTSAPGSGFTLQDTLNAGMPTGAGIHDAATDPDRLSKPKPDRMPLSPKMDAARSQYLDMATAAGKDLFGARDKVDIDTRNAAKPAAKQEAVQAMKKRDRQKANQNNLAHLEQTRKNEARQRQAIQDKDRMRTNQWTNTIDAAMEANFPDDPLDE